ncbi:SIS domain-containing protein [Thermatribacter velox]|uniref:SIS domain-containing protein n=1 Tax=Thermatribacter velox TaxID=3039681 RepID=A0ABZ2Y9Y3_9BACT
MNHTYLEIHKQPITWEKTLSHLQQKAKTNQFLNKKYDEIIFTGCGSSYNLSLTASYLWQAINQERTRGVPASEIFLFPEGVFLPNQQYLLFGISRSGETSETIKALQTSEKENTTIDTVGITCEDNSTLIHYSKYQVITSEAHEESVVMTQSFSTMLLSLLFLALKKKENLPRALFELPSLLNELLPTGERIVQSLANDFSFEKFIFLGSGPFYGIAWEGSLKLKEMSLTPTETFHFLEFRHGPKSIVDEKTLIIALTSEKAFDLEKVVLSEMISLGATILNLGKKPLNLDKSKIVEIVFENPSLNDFFTPILDVVFLQLLGYFRACNKGLNPDKPKNLTKVVKLN